MAGYAEFMVYPGAVLLVTFDLDLIPSKSAEDKSVLASVIF